MDETILLTACLNPGATPFVFLRDSKARRLQYLCALVAWLTKTQRARRVVICDNSGESLDIGGLSLLAEQNGKSFEALTFTGNQGAQQFGKGHGEGEIILHALEKSRLMREQSHFYKITGRLFVPDFDAYAERYRAHEQVFAPPSGFSPSKLLTISGRAARWYQWARQMRWRASLVHSLIKRARLSFELGRIVFPEESTQTIDTRFFKTSRGFYAEVLSRAHLEVRDQLGYYLEHAYYRALAGTINVAFAPTPRITGESATNGAQYEGVYDLEILRVAQSLL